MPFTVTPKAANSRASENVSEVSAPLDVEYAVPGREIQQLPNPLLEAARQIGQPA